MPTTLFWCVVRKTFLLKLKIDPLYLQAGVAQPDQHGAMYNAEDCPPFKNRPDHMTSRTSSPDVSVRYCTNVYLYSETMRPRCSTAERLTLIKNFFKNCRLDWLHVIGVTGAR